MEAEWQPARLRMVHSGVGDGQDIPAEELTPMLRKVVRIRVANPSLMTVIDYRAEGCNANVFYLIHPDDMEIENRSDVPAFACEHEILTD